MTTTAKILCVGVGKSAVAGSCAGADLDAQRMFDLFRKTFSNISYSKLLINEAATKDMVKTALEAVCSGDESTVSVFFFAGHGGSQKLKAYAPEEADGRDEYIMLSDTYFIDDEIWGIVSKAPGRVFLVFDCCHSETMFRLSYEKPSLIKSIWLGLKETVAYWFGTTREAEKISSSFYAPTFTELLCWSGCADDKTSKGNMSGGVFTNAILRTYETNKALLYEAFWGKLTQDNRLNSAEIAKHTLIKNKNSENSFSKFSVFK